MLHPWLGALTLGGAVRPDDADDRQRDPDAAPGRRHPPVGRRAQRDCRLQRPQRRHPQGDGLRRPGGRARYNRANEDHLDLQTRTNDISGTFGAISRVLRMILQSAVLGMGAYLTINGELSAGAIIAASVASARALAPIDLAIGNWKSVVAARTAFGADQGNGDGAGGRGRRRWSCRRPSRLAEGREHHGGGARLRPRASERRELRAQGRPGAGHHRPERRRQDHAGARADRASGPCCAAACGWTTPS